MCMRINNSCRCFVAPPASPGSQGLRGNASPQAHLQAVCVSHMPPPLQGQRQHGQNDFSVETETGTLYIQTALWLTAQSMPGQVKLRSWRTRSPAFAPFSTKVDYFNIKDK